MVIGASHTGIDCLQRLPPVRGSLNSRGSPDREDIPIELFLQGKTRARDIFTYCLGQVLLEIKVAPAGAWEDLESI